MKWFYKFILLILLCTLAASCSKSSYNKKISINGKILFVEEVSTPEKMAQGLSNRISLAENQGMLFNFGDNASVTPEFWMKDMEFDLDLIWIKNKKIIGLTNNVPAPKINNAALTIYRPQSPVDEVLEVKAGWAEKNKIRIGDEVIK